MNYQIKYLKYKNKYLKLKKQLGGDKIVIKVLYLCATNTTKKIAPPKLQEIINKHLTDNEVNLEDVEYENYFLGLDVNMTKENPNECVYRLGYDSYIPEETISKKCDFIENTYDYIVSEYCTSPVFFSELTLTDIARLLKLNGHYILQNMRTSLISPDKKYNGYTFNYISSSKDNQFNIYKKEN